MKKLSVIIPTFNRAKFLYSTLICLCSQNGIGNDEYEIIIVDSGNDDTESLVNEFIKTVPVNIIYKKNESCKNRSLLRNLGAGEAKNEILCFLDNDIMVPPDFLSEVQRQFEENKSNVLLGLRHSLTEFSLEEFGAQNLVDNFNFLEELPWYDDERTLYELKGNEWRFCFSHTLILEKKLFFKVGEFNEGFGEHWGYEDLELGFRLLQNKANFSYLKNIFVYHQPHFSQSNFEQHETMENGLLFLKLHNCMEVELQECFYEIYDEIKNALNIITLAEKIPDKEFDLYLAEIIPFYNSSEYNNHQLGCIVPYESHKYSDCFINSSFFDFPFVLQAAILNEAFRVCRDVYFLREHFDYERMKGICSRAGICFTLQTYKDFCIIRLSSYKKPKAFNFILPDVLQPKKRFLYFWLANELSSRNAIIQFSDLRKNSEIYECDYKMKFCSENIMNSFGGIPYQTICSGTTFENYGRNIFKSRNCINIIDDREFFYSKTVNVFDGMFSSETLKTLNCVCAKKMIDSFNLRELNEYNANNYLCFMENGFYEDGVDYAIEFFSKIKQRNRKAKLIVKAYNFYETIRYSYPLHNSVSRENKFFKSSEEFKKNMLLLKDLIFQKKLTESIEIITENYELKDNLELIANSNGIINMSRITSVPLTSYIALMLRKDVFVFDSMSLDEALKHNCIVADSKLCKLSESFAVPNNIHTMSIFACKKQDDFDGNADAQRISDNSEMEKYIDSCRHGFNKILDDLLG